MTMVENEAWYSDFKRRAVNKTLKPGEVYVLQGAEQSHIGMIVSGTVTAIAYSYEGDETWLGEYNPGDFVGLLPFLTQNVSTFEIRAEEPVTLYDVSTRTMKTLMRESTPLCTKISSDLAKRLNQSVTQIIDLQTLSVKGRICAELLRLSLPIGVNPDHHIIRPSPVFTELARRLNSTRETVSRTISDLQRKGLLARKPGALIIENPQKLKTVVAKI